MRRCAICGVVIEEDMRLYTWKGKDYCGACFDYTETEEKEKDAKK